MHGYLRWKELKFERRHQHEFIVSCASSYISVTSSSELMFLLLLFVEQGPVTELLAGSTFEVSWFMGYAHPVSTVSLSLVLDYRTVCHQTLSHVTLCRGSGENLSHFSLDSFTPLFWFSIFPRGLAVFTCDSIICYSAYMPRQFRLSVRLSVTRVICIKTAERIVEILSRSDRPTILIFLHQGSLRKSYGFTTKGGAEYKGLLGSDFRTICGYISETAIDRGIVIVTMEEEYKVACALSHSTTFDDLEWPRTPVPRSQYGLEANISQTVHPIHSMFGSRL